MTAAASGLAVIATHPVQYQAPIYRAVQERFGIPVTVIYGSDCSIAGYFDQEFQTAIAWDTDLLSGYTPIFLSRAPSGDPFSLEELSSQGLSAALRRLAPAAVLLTGSGPRFHRRAFWAAWQGGYPLLYRADATDHLRTGGLRQWPRDAALRWFYRRCDALLYTGTNALHHFRRLLGPATKLIASPCCVDASTFQAEEEVRPSLRAETRVRLGLDARRLILLFAGKLVPVKATEMLVRAVKEMPQETRARFTLLFVGDGPLGGALARQAAAPPALDVRFVGFQNQRSLSRYYHAADLLVLPSHGETWGLVVNEALHHGLPCVVSNRVGCAPDLIEPGVSGELFEAGSMASLTAALRRGLRLARRGDIRAQCRSKVRAFSVDRAARGIAQAFLQVTEGAAAKVSTAFACT